MDVSGGDRKARAESVIFRARCPGCEPSTPDPEQAADVSPHESDLWLRIYGLDSDMAPSVSPVLMGPDPGWSPAEGPTQLWGP